MRFEMELQAFTGTAAQLSALHDDVQAGMDSSAVDIDQGHETINQIRPHPYDNVPYLLVSLAGTTRAGADRVFDFIVSSLQRPNRGVNTARSTFWLREVNDAGAVTSERRWP
jgi:hypothetical protein